MFGKAKKISDNSVEELARTFAKVVKRNYIEYLKFSKVTDMNSSDEAKRWQCEIETEAEIVEVNTYNKILKIIREPKNHRELFKKKWWFFRSKTVIVITKTSGFYDDLLLGKGIEQSVPANVEYIIYIKHLCFDKRIYS